MKHIKQVDPEVYSAIYEEIKRQEYKLELIASENYVSEAVLEAVVSATSPWSVDVPCVLI